MIITWFAHKTDSDGLTPDGLKFRPSGGVAKSHPAGGCGADDCDCAPGHWIRKSFPRTEDGIVGGFSVHFHSRHELEAADLAKVEQTARMIIH